MNQNPSPDVGCHLGHELLGYKICKLCEDSGVVFTPEDSLLGAWTASLAWFTLQHIEFIVQLLPMSAHFALQWAAHWSSCPQSAPSFQLTSQRLRCIHRFTLCHDTIFSLSDMSGCMNTTSLQGALSVPHEQNSPQPPATQVLHSELCVPHSFPPQASNLHILLCSIQVPNPLSSWHLSWTPVCCLYGNSAPQFTAFTSIQHSP